MPVWPIDSVACIRVTTLGVFQDVFDWTAVGTLALAAATFVSLFFARRSINQTQREIELSRNEVEEAHRPVLVPAADERIVSIGRGTSHRERLAYPGPDVSGALIFPVENIGAGPALQVEAFVHVTDLEGNVVSHRPVCLAGLGEGRLVPLLVLHAQWDIRADFDFTINYRDVGNRAWATAGRWSGANAWYEQLTIKAAAISS